MNGRRHCADGSDEDPQYHIRNNCSDISMHLCDDRAQCIFEGNWCDGKSAAHEGHIGYYLYDCLDGSDEGHHCEDYECFPNTF